jgi:hypothetical protein
MKKEVLIAIIIGFALGLIITYGVHTAQQSITNRDQQQEVPKTESLLPSLNTTHHLNITSPTTYQLTSTSPFNVSGITSPNSIIAVIAATSEEAVVADPQGNFSAAINLEPGENFIKIVSYLESSGESVEQTVSIVYSTAKLEEVSSNPDQDEAQ